MSWWIARAERILTEQIPAPPDQVRAFYVDLDNIKLVHPLVTSVRTIGREETPGAYTQTYRVHDRIPLRLCTLRTSYVAKLYVPVSGDVITEARQFPRVRLHSVVSFEPSDQGTRVTERARIAAPRMLATLTTREAVNAHIAMLSGIRHRFENR